jgi:RNA polymerase sigma-70 factor (ECF subfamily)
MAYHDDVELARQCADGDERAWERFILEYRALLYRAADALEPHGGARELADALYADLYGLQERGGERQSLLRYYQGRSSLATWLRAVLAQRFVDRVRAQRRLEPLPAEEAESADRTAFAKATARQEPNPDRGRYRALAQEAVARAIARLGERDRLRLRLYYGQDLTLAETGRALGEHEATASRQLARTRSKIRAEAECQLGEEAGLSPPQIAECFETLVEDPGDLRLEELLGSAERKKSARDRSL